MRYRSTLSRATLSLATVLALLACTASLAVANESDKPDAVSQQTASTVPYTKNVRHYFARLGSYAGIDDRKDLDTRLLGLGIAYYIFDGLGVSGEFVTVTGRGTLTGRDADSEAIGGFFALRWHFLRSEHVSLFFNHGYGMIRFNNEFPPGGTHFNALLQYSVGMTLHINTTYSVLLGAANSHISNGRGAVGENPSFDGRGFYLGLERRF